MKNTLENLYAHKFDVISFRKELFALYKKYDLTISHEDGQGAFEIYPYDERNVKWMDEAFEREVKELNEKIKVKELEKLL